MGMIFCSPRVVDEECAWFWVSVWKVFINPGNQYRNEIQGQNVGKSQAINKEHKQGKNKLKTETLKTW